jgi:hypothetical protein
MTRTQKFTKLNDTFNIANTVDVDVEIVKAEPVAKPIVNDVETDYKYSRENYYTIIEKGQEAIQNALELAQELDTARGYEVVGHLIKSVSDAADKLINLQQKMKDIEDTRPKGPSSVTTNNVVFTGTTAEALKLIKKQFSEET